MLTMPGIRPRRSPPRRRGLRSTARCAGAWPAHGAARRGLARRSTGRSSRATRASPGRRGSPPAAVGRSARGCGSAPAGPAPPGATRRLMASLAGLGRFALTSASACAPRPDRPGPPRRRRRHRRSSRLIVDGSRPSSAGDLTHPRPAAREQAISSALGERQASPRGFHQRRHHPASLTEPPPARARPRHPTAPAASAAPTPARTATPEPSLHLPRQPRTTLSHTSITKVLRSPPEPKMPSS